MAAIIDACQSGQIPASVSVVVAPNFESEAISAARARGTQVITVDPADPAYPQLLIEALQDVTVVCLAGYLRLLPVEVLRKFPGRVLNIHPALLPKFGGKGMYGRHVHEAVIASGDSESGASVHLVDERYDEGQVLVQRRCSVLPDDTPQSLAARVLTEEHLAYVEALQRLLS
jgi:formyltetrahydrofolate-dependent phosphoribosylglycinamide formyltransferase